MDHFARFLNRGAAKPVRLALRASLANGRERAFLFAYLGALRRAARLRLRFEKEGLHVPPYLIASIASSCNLFCAGCYARANNAVGGSACETQLSDGDWARIFTEAKALGVTFILLAGGEPFTRRSVIEAAADTKEVLFPVFTNGTMFDGAYLSLFDRHRNLVPMLSLEGGEAETDRRRGAGVYAKLLAAMAEMKKRGILYGVSITVTKENLLSVTESAYADALRARGCGVVLYVEYVPVESANASLALGEDERKELMRRVDALRKKRRSLVVIAFPGDEDAMGGCLAAGRGFFHISARGDAEPCPFSPFSDTNLKNVSLREALASPLFKKLQLGGFLEGEHAGGCALYPREAEIRALAEQEA